MEAKIAAVKAHAMCAFASFKFAKDHRYHRTYDLPPKTVLLGFLGAALGLNEDQIYSEWCGDKPLVDRVRVAVILKYLKGRVRDTWKITKNIPGKKSIEKSVIVREQLYHPEYVIYAATHDLSMLTEIQRRLDNPVFPLSLGRDDELALVTQVQRVDLIRARPPILLQNTILPFDLGKITRKVDVRPGYRMKPHLKQYLPHRFSIVNGVRYPADEGIFTFLTGYRVKIQGDIEAYSDVQESEETNIVFL